MSKDKPKKRKRWARNKYRDVFTDYYVTNREYGKENAERQKEMPRKWQSSEIVMIVVIAVALVGCIVRYVILR